MRFLLAPSLLALSTQTFASSPVDSDAAWVATAPPEVTTHSCTATLTDSSEVEKAPPGKTLEWDKNWFGVLITNRSLFTIERIMCGSLEAGEYVEVDLLGGKVIPPGGVEYIHYFDDTGTCRNAFVAQGWMNEGTWEDVIVFDHCGYKRWTIDSLRPKPPTSI